MNLLLLQVAETAGQYSYSRPFLQPLPVWDYWYLLLLPLLVGIAFVYKGIKCSDVSEVPREALKMVLWIVVAFVLAAVALLLFVNLMERL